MAPVMRAFSLGSICFMLLLTVTGLSANYVNRTQQFLDSFKLAPGPLFEVGTFGFGTPIKIEDDAPQSFKLLANSLLQIEQLNGDLEIRPGNSTQAVAHLTKFVRTKDEASARATAQNVRLQISPGDKTIQLGVNAETVSDAVTVSLLLELPRQTAIRLAITNASGQVKLTDLRGEQTIRNCGKLTVNRHSGRLTISGARGPVSLRNTQGDVSLTDLQNGADLDEIEGVITLAAHGGVYHLKNIKGGIRGSLSNGKLELAGLEAIAQAAQAERVVNLDEVRDARVQLNEIQWKCLHQSRTLKN